LKQAFEAVTPQQQDAFLLKMLKKREEENRMTKLTSKKKGGDVIFFRVPQMPLEPAMSETEPVTTGDWRRFNNLFTGRMRGAFLTCIGGSKHRGAYLMARLLGFRHKDAAERGMIDAGSIVKHGKQETMIMLPRQYYTEEHFEQYSRPIRNMSSGGEAFKSDGCEARTRLITSDAGKSWLFDYFRGLRPGDKNDHYYT
jgi:hypothetical protein